MLTIVNYPVYLLGVVSDGNGVGVLGSKFHSKVLRKHIGI